jgi:ubiquinone/menaquinone biosynthesis C-methylase UbiE
MDNSHKSHEWTEERSVRFVEKSKNFLNSRYKPFAKDIVNFMETFNIKHNPKVLDLGCGPGLLLFEIKKLVPNVTLIGLDPSDYMLATAKENAKYYQINELELKRGYAEEVPIDDNEIDVIICFNSLHDFKDAKKAVKNSYRILRNGGILILKDKNGSYPKWKVKLGFIPYVLKMGFESTRIYLKSGKDWFDPIEVSNWLLKVGYKIKKLEEKLDYLIVAEK